MKIRIAPVRGRDLVLNATLCAAFAAMIVLICLEVFLRNWQGASLAWYDEVGRLLLVWTTFLGVAAATRDHAHYIVDLLDIRLSPRVAKYFSLICDVVVGIVAVVFVVKGIELVRSESIQHLPVTGLSVAWLDSPLVIGSGLVFVYAIRNFLTKVSAK